MPIVNAMVGVQNEARISVPDAILPDSRGVNRRIRWSDPERFIVTNFSSKEIATVSFDETVLKGSPVGSMLSFGDSVWQVDFSIPFLVWDPNYFADQGISMFEYGEAPHWANMPVQLEPTPTPAYYADAVFRFFKAAATFLLGSEISNRGLWDEHWSTITPASSEIDVIVQKIGIEVSDDRAVLTVSLLSTTDPRSRFELIQEDMTTSPGPTRVAKPWDFEIPRRVDTLGSPLTVYSGGWGVTPTRRQYSALPGSFSLVSSWSLSVECQVTRFRSIGTPTARPILGISSQKCEGRLSYLPLYRSTSGGKEYGSIAGPLSYDRLPTGWRVDSQSMEYIQRFGGQLFVSGHPDYQTDGIRPVFPEMDLRYGVQTTHYDPDDHGRIVGYTYTPMNYRVVSRDMVGPIVVATAGVEASGTGINTVSIDYKTILGVTDASQEFFDEIAPD